MNKYTYWKVIQGDYGQGWEDESFYETDSIGYMHKAERQVFMQDLKEYRFASYEGKIRTVLRREKREELPEVIDT